MPEVSPLSELPAFLFLPGVIVCVSGNGHLHGPGQGLRSPALGWKIVVFMNTYDLGLAL
jgi:hypothetical protein